MPHPAIHPASSALLVIDVQESFTHRPYFAPAGVADFRVAQNELIAGALVGTGLDVWLVQAGIQRLIVPQALCHVQAD